MIRKFKYGQWIVTIELHDEYWEIIARYQSCIVK